MLSLFILQNRDKLWSDVTHGSYADLSIRDSSLAPGETKSIIMLFCALRFTLQIPGLGLLIQENKRANLESFG